MSHNTTVLKCALFFPLFFARMGQSMTGQVGRAADKLEAVWTLNRTTGSSLLSLYQRAMLRIGVPLTKGIVYSKLDARNKSEGMMDESREEWEAVEKSFPKPFYRGAPD